MDLDLVLSNCVAQVFGEILGESCAKAIYYHIGMDLSAENAGQFSEELERIFGIGADVLEKGIIEELNLQFGQRIPVKKGIRLADYINQLQEFLGSDN